MFLKSLCLILIVFLFSCNRVNKRSDIKFSKDSSSIIVNNIQPSSVLQVKNYLKARLDTNKMFSVLLEPKNEVDSSDRILISGKVILQGDSLIFNPDKSFVKGGSYLVESYIDAQFGNNEKLLKSEGKPRFEPRVQLLRR